ncbi:MAG TPA: arsenic resistance N-acetyltransferase ArsN2 [Longimicrobium sp.]|nr:arsenic resistance N-acetyltransferase ArsN2 [Longimicrobium sp.]
MIPEPARPADFDAIVTLLGDASLPHEDLTPGHLKHFLVLRDGDGIAGVVGMEVADDAGLLRSLAVPEARRGGGLASRLVDALEAHARAAGIRTLYLLTTTAEGFFARRGYVRADRAAVPEAIAATAEFRSICPSTAACMAKALVPAEVPASVGT